PPVDPHGYAPSAARRSRSPGILPSSLRQRGRSHVDLLLARPASAGWSSALPRALAVRAAVGWEARCHGSGCVGAVPPPQSETGRTRLQGSEPPRWHSFLEMAWLISLPK